MKFSWSSIGGGVLAVLGFLSQPAVLGALPAKAAGVVGLVGTLIAMFSHPAVQKAS